jgi:hypothetical protein
VRVRERERERVSESEREIDKRICLWDQQKKIIGLVCVTACENSYIGG